MNAHRIHKGQCKLNRFLGGPNIKKQLPDISPSEQAYLGGQTALGREVSLNIFDCQGKASSYIKYYIFPLHQRNLNNFIGFDKSAMVEMPSPQVPTPQQARLWFVLERDPLVFPSCIHRTVAGGEAHQRNTSRQSKGYYTMPLFFQAD